MADAPAATAAAAAPALSAAITSTARASSSSSACPRLRAVTTAPAPSGLVSTSASPTRPPALAITRSGCTAPVTARPYLGSGSSIECPPTTSAPAARTTSSPPRSTSPSAAGAELLERPGHDVERGQGPPAHGVDVGQRVGRGDAAEVVGVVDDRREEVDGLHERELVGDPPHRRVVAGRRAHEQLGRRRRRQAADDRQEGRGRQLASAPGAVGERGERDRCDIHAGRCY